MARKSDEVFEESLTEEPETEVRRGRPPKVRMMECVEKCLYRDILIQPGTIFPVEGEIPTNFKAID